jgi:hypothetical protein
MKFIIAPSRISAVTSLPSRITLAFALSVETHSAIVDS